MRAADYTYQVEWCDVIGEYEAYCAELPGISWSDEDPAFARMGCVQLVADYLADGEVVHDG